MTIIEREVTKEKAEKKTVSTCDICGIAKVDMPQEDEIVTMKSGKSLDLTYIIKTIQLDTGDREEKEFDSIDDAENFILDLNKDKYRFDKYTDIDLSWELNIDICTHCISTLFGQAEDLVEQSENMGGVSRDSKNEKKVGSTLGSGKPPKNQRGWKVENAANKSFAEKDRERRNR